jgi:hypothetical protein
MTEEKKGNRPTHIAYQVRNYKAGDKEASDWSRVGSAWVHKDGKGFDLTLESVPLSGRVVLRLNEPKAKSGE